MCVHVQGLSEKYPVMYYEKATFTGEDKRYKKHCTQDNDALVLFKVGILEPHTVLPIAVRCPVVFSWISMIARNLFPFKGDFSFGKSQKSQGTKSGLWGAESPGWFDVLPKNSTWDVMHEQVCCRDEAANHQLPIVVASWINWIVSTEERSSLTQNLMWICWSTQSFWIRWPHSTRAHSMASTAPTDSYSEVGIVHVSTFQSTLLGCQVTSMSCKLFSLY